MINILNKNIINLTKKHAFTLAEILITLGIIGVVAAITMPTLIKNYKAIVLRSQFNKAYTSFAQATQMILTQEFDNNPNLFEETNGSKLLNYYQKHMRKAVKCDKYDICPTNIFPKARNGDLGSTFVAENYKTYTGYEMYTNYISDSSIVLQDNTFAIIDNGYPKKYIAIDINGWRKAPNKLGHDFFMFQIVDGVLKPMGAEGTNAMWNVCSKTSNSSLNGRGCTAKALSDKDYFKNLP